MPGRVKPGPRRPEGVRRGIFGGSFDPVHNGHLEVVASAATQLELDVVHVVPVGRQPFKLNGPWAPPDARVAMLQAALGADRSYLVDDREIRRGGTSYSADTVREVREEFPSDWLCLLVGADTAVDFPQWRDAEQIAQLAEVIVLSRGGRTSPRYPLLAQVVTVPDVPISATEIRARVSRGESIERLVPRAVAAYIDRHGLYREGAVEAGC